MGWRLERRVTECRILLALVLAACACRSSTAPSSVSLTGIDPSGGTTLGGTRVIISGKNFAGSATVTIGGTPATGVTMMSPTSIAATTPPHAAGAADVVVALSDGQRATLTGAYNYVRPQPVVNTPPAIASIVVQGTVGPREPAQFASSGETVGVTATVTDAETPPSQLTYQWASDIGGTFSGNGARLSWTAPSLTATPVTAVLTLTVIEQYQDTDDSGLPVTRQNTVTGSTSVRVHDSVREINDLAVDFLIGFSKQLDPAYVVRNFTSTCAGTAAEYGDVLKNNQQNTITSYFVGTPDTTLVFVGAGGCPFRGEFGDACAQVPVEWHSTNKVTGVSGVAKGTDQVAAVVENDQWRLCSSNFNQVSTATDFRKFLVIR